MAKAKKTAVIKSKSNVPLLHNRFQRGSQLGSGAFGTIYQAYDTLTKINCALKVEDVLTGHNQLNQEHTIYEILKQRRFTKKDGFLEMLDYFIEGRQRYLAFTLVGKSLESTFQHNGKKMDTKSACMIALQLIDHIEKLHNLGFVHRDIKPDNMAFGIGEDSDTLYMLDLGLGKKFKNGSRHVHMNTGKHLVGTARYASMHSHKGYELSRRDDLESIAYSLIYLQKGSLPWQGYQSNYRLTKYQQIYNKKKSTPSAELCKGLEPEFREFLKYTRTLEFIEKPNYDKWKKNFEGVLKRIGHENDGIYPWTKKTDPAYIRQKKKVKEARLTEEKEKKRKLELQRLNKSLKKRKVYIPPSKTDLFFSPHMPLLDRRVIILQNMADAKFPSLAPPMFPPKKDDVKVIKDGNAKDGDADPTGQGKIQGGGVKQIGAPGAVQDGEHVPQGGANGVVDGASKPNDLDKPEAQGKAVEIPADCNVVTPADGKATAHPTNVGLANERPENEAVPQPTTQAPTQEVAPQPTIQAPVQEASQVAETPAAIESPDNKAPATPDFDVPSKDQAMVVSAAQVPAEEGEVVDDTDVDVPAKPQDPAPAAAAPASNADATNKDVPVNNADVTKNIDATKVVAPATNVDATKNAAPANNAVVAPAINANASKAVAPAGNATESSKKKNKNVAVATTAIVVAQPAQAGKGKKKNKKHKAEAAAASEPDPKKKTRKQQQAEVLLQAQSQAQVELEAAQKAENEKIERERLEYQKRIALSYRQQEPKISYEPKQQEKQIHLPAFQQRQPCPLYPPKVFFHPTFGTPGQMPQTHQQTSMFLF